MSKYIEMDELISAIKMAPVWTGLDAIERIKTLPTIDIVWCKECRWFNKGENESCSWSDCTRHFGHYINVNDDDFCSYGERKDEPYEYEIKTLYKDYVEPYVKIEDEPQTEETEMERLERIDNEIEDAWARIRELTDEPQTDCSWK